MNPRIKTATTLTEGQPIGTLSDRLPNLFPAPPAYPNADLIEAFLNQITQTIDQIEHVASESDLRVFTQWALRQSYSAHWQLDQRLRLLGLAWRVQKLLWSMQAQSRVQS